VNHLRPHLEFRVDTGCPGLVGEGPRVVEDAFRSTDLHEQRRHPVRSALMGDAALAFGFAAGREIVAEATAS
jgi:hypothetical protein